MLDGVQPRPAVELPLRSFLQMAVDMPKHALSENERIAIAKRLFCDLLLLSAERGHESVETVAVDAISGAELLSAELAQRGYHMDEDNEDDRG